MDIHAPASDNIDELRRIADANGVATGFWDWYGNWVGVSASTLLKVLGALGLPLDESSTVPARAAGTSSRCMCQTARGSTSSGCSKMVAKVRVTRWIATFRPV